MNDKEITNELKNALLFDSTIDDGVVTRIANITGFSKRTVYDYLDGKIRMSTAFLHAAVIASDGHPRVKSFLEPQGWMLTPKATVKSCEAPDWEKEMGDVHIAAANLHGSLREALADGSISESELNRLIRDGDDLRREWDEVLSLARATTKSEG